MPDAPLVTDMTTAPATTDTSAGRPQEAVQEAAVAAAEAIAAEAAASVATEAAAIAEAAVHAASAAAAKAAVRASRTAAQAVSAAAAAAAETAMQNALDAEVGVDNLTATAVASVAVSLALAGAYDGNEASDGAVVLAGSSWDGDVADAIMTSTAASAMAAAKVAVAVAAAAAAAATAAIDAATLIEGQLGRNVAAAATAVGRAIAAHANEVARAALHANAAHDALDDGSGWNRAAPHAAPHTEWAVALSDPMMPTFAPEGDPQATLISFAPPAEQGLWRDISLARRMELALRASEAQFEAAFDNAPTAMLVASLVAGMPAQFLRVNAALSLLTGLPPAELLEMGFADLAHPEQPALEQDLADPRGAEDDKTYERVQRWVHADGRDIWVRIRMSVIRSENNDADQLICQVEDISARLIADAALRGSEARFRLAFAGAPQAAVLVELAGNRPGRLSAANLAACEMFGRSEIEMLWLDLDTLTHPLDRPMLRDLLQKLWSGELSHYDGEHRYQTSAGDIGWLVLTAHVVQGVDGRPEHALAYLRDDTDHDAPARRTTTTPRPDLAPAPVAEQEIGTARAARSGVPGSAAGPGVARKELLRTAASDLAGRAPHRMLLERAQLLGIDTAEQAACMLVRVVHSLGGSCVPARLAGADALPIDISMGEGESLLAVAPIGSEARAALERELPSLLHDLQEAVHPHRQSP